MPKNAETLHSILIVSSSEQFQAIVKRSLKDFLTIDVKKSASSARRCILERYYDIVVVDGPLPDESGEELTVFVTEKSQASVLIVIPREVFDDVTERVTDHGIMAVPKPAPKGRIDKAIRFLIATQNRFHKLEKKTLSVEEKMEEIRTVSKAKLILVEKKHMSEDEAHRYIGKLAMDNGVSRKRIAEKILEDFS